MKTIKILLILALLFQQVTDFGYALPVGSENNHIMSVGNQTQADGLVSYLQQRENLVSNNQAQQAPPAINVPSNGYDSPAAIGIAPDGATANAAATSRGLSLSYSTGTAGWAGAGFDYGLTPANLAGMTELVVGLKGTPGMVKLEIKDKNGKMAFVYLDSIKADVEQVWVIPLDYFVTKGVDLSNVQLIDCIVEGNNQTGTLEFNRSLTPMWIEPSTSLTSQNINLPAVGLNNPSQTAVAPDPAQITNLTVTARGISFNYNTEAPAGSPSANSDGWAGAGFSYDNLTTPLKESFDLKSALGNSPLVIGIKGDCGKIRLEIVDKNGQKDAVLLDGVSASQENVWAVSLSEFQGVDLNNVSYIYFIVEGANKTGYLEINRLADSVYIPPDPTKHASDINIPTEGLTIPGGVTVAPTGAIETLTRTSRGISVAYSTNSGANAGWAGAGFSYAGTALGYQDLSNLSSLIFSLQSSESTLKLELVDSLGNKSAIYLSGASATTETFYSVDFTKLVGKADLKKISFIYVIVEGDNKTGTLELNDLKVSNMISADPTKTASDINIPTEGLTIPGGVTVNPTGATATLTTTPRGISVAYSTNSGANAGWAGAGFSYAGTALGYQDFSGLTNLVFSLRSTESNSALKLELVDSTGKKSAIYLITDFLPTNSRMKFPVRSETFYSIDLSKMVGNADLTKVSFIYVIVEGDNKTGTLELNDLKEPNTIPPDPTKNLTNVNVPATDIYVPSPMVVNPSGATGTMTRTDHGMVIGNYNTGSGVNGGWIGADLNYATAQNLTGQTIVLGVQCSEGTLKFELSDSSGNKSAIYLTGVSATTMQYYSIDVSKLSGNADLSKIQNMAIVIEGENKAGNFLVNYTPKTLIARYDPSKTIADVNIPVNSLTDPAAGVFKPTAVIGDLTLTTYGFAINNYDTKSGVNGGWIGANLGYATSTDLTGKTTVKLELSDSLGNKSAIYLSGVSASNMQYYSVSVSALLGSADLSKVKNITVVVEGDNKIGSLAIDYTKNSTTIPPDPTKNLTNVNIPATDIFVPSPMMVNPSSATGTMVRIDHGMAINNYNTSSGANGGWIGANLNYASPQNLSGTTIVMGVQGASSTVKLELSDSLGAKSAIYLTGVSATTMQYYSIDLSKLSGSADLTKVANIAIVVEGNNKTGNLLINYTPKTITTPNDPTKTGSDVNIPINSLTDPAPGVFKPTAVIGDLTLTTYGFAINNYDTKSGVNGGWIGANLGYATSTDLTGKT
ncbi:MAG: hypothetical protein NTY76_00645, partial [Candidatus Omnitrophica bacterium]|nr:hypothetical protein [Candidatus Omnitrophota bacterium]